jgi:hypothetical protein
MVPVCFFLAREGEVATLEKRAHVRQVLGSVLRSGE